jgi:uncharacterized protein (TIGR03067 family)
VKYILTLGILTLFVGLPARAQDDSEKDLKALQGKWTVVSLEENGKDDLPKGGVTVEFKGSKAVYLEANQKPEEAEIKLNAGETPRQMDLTLAADPKDKNDKGLKIQAIYQLEGDTLKICYKSPANLKGATETERPKEFDSKNGGLLMQLKRAK